MSSCAGLPALPTPHLLHQPHKHTPSVLSIGISFRVVKRLILEKYVTEYYSLSVKTNALDMRITTTGVRAMLCPSHPGVLCAMVVRERASGGARVQRRKTSDVSLAEDVRTEAGGGGPRMAKPKAAPQHAPVQATTGVTGDDGPPHHLGIMRLCTAISLRMPTMPARCSPRTA
jgi:hypothetical protein